MLRRSTKLLLTTEVIVCFAPLLVLLWLAGLLLPIQISALDEEPLLWQGPAVVIGSVACGAIGLVTLLYVMGKLFVAHSSIRTPALICSGVALGILPVVPIAVFGDSFGKLVGVLPLAVSAHILWLGRRMLFPSWREGLRCIAVASVVPLILLSALIINPFETTRRTLEGQKAFWEEVAPDRYEFTVQLSGWVDREALSPKRITVENGEVVAAVYVWDSHRHKSGAPAPVDNLWTIERAFSELLAASDRGWNVSARFDERWGFVERAFVDTSESRSAWDLEIRDFRVESFPAEAQNN